MTTLNAYGNYSIKTATGNETVVNLKPSPGGKQWFLLPDEKTVSALNEWAQAWNLGGQFVTSDQSGHGLPGFVIEGKFMKLGRNTDSDRGLSLSRFLTEIGYKQDSPAL